MCIKVNNHAHYLRHNDNFSCSIIILIIIQTQPSLNHSCFRGPLWTWRAEEAAGYRENVVERRLCFDSQGWQGYTLQMSGAPTTVLANFQSGALWEAGWLWRLIDSEAPGLLAWTLSHRLSALNAAEFPAVPGLSSTLPVLDWGCSFFKTFHYRHLQTYTREKSEVKWTSLYPSSSFRTFQLLPILCHRFPPQFWRGENNGGWSS